MRSPNAPWRPWDDGPPSSAHGHEANAVGSPSTVSADSHYQPQHHDVKSKPATSPIAVAHQPGTQQWRDALSPVAPVASTSVQSTPIGGPVHGERSYWPPGHHTWGDADANAQRPATATAAQELPHDTPAAVAALAIDSPSTDNGDKKLDPLVAAIIEPKPFEEAQHAAGSPDAPNWSLISNRKRKPFVYRPDRPCTHCGVTVSCTWRPGPAGPGSLCNACGYTYRRHGRLDVVRRRRQVKRSTSLQDFEVQQSESMESARRAAVRSVESLDPALTLRRDGSDAATYNVRPTLEITPEGSMPTPPPPPLRPPPIHSAQRRRPAPIPLPRNRPPYVPAPPVRHEGSRSPSPRHPQQHQQEPSHMPPTPYHYRHYPYPMHAHPPLPPPHPHMREMERGEGWSGYEHGQYGPPRYGYPGSGEPPAPYYGSGPPPRWAPYHAERPQSQPQSQPQRRSSGEDWPPQEYGRPQYPEDTQQPPHRSPQAEQRHDRHSPRT